MLPVEFSQTAIDLRIEGIVARLCGTTFIANEHVTNCDGGYTTIPHTVNNMTIIHLVTDSLEPESVCYTFSHSNASSVAILCFVHFIPTARARDECTRGSPGTVCERCCSSE